MGQVKNIDTYFRDYLGMLYDSEVEHELLGKAKLMVCSLARDANDADFLLKALGLKE